MAILTIDVPDSLNHELQDRGLSPQQLEMLVIRLIRLYLHQYEVQETVSLFKEEIEIDEVEPEPSKSPHPKFGSGKHLNIQMADDFDEPLEDFAEYM